MFSETIWLSFKTSTSLQVTLLAQNNGRMALIHWLDKRSDYSEVNSCSFLNFCWKRRHLWPPERIATLPRWIWQNKELCTPWPELSSPEHILSVRHRNIAALFVLPVATLIWCPVPNLLPESCFLDSCWQIFRSLYDLLYLNPTRPPYFQCVPHNSSSGISRVLCPHLDPVSKIALS